MPGIRKSLKAEDEYISQVSKLAATGWSQLVTLFKNYIGLKNTLVFLY